jgi:3-methyladenine DNA glycosylase AlkD
MRAARRSLVERLIEGVRRALADHADARKAPGMQAYMKSAMPYRGVMMPVQRQIWRQVFSAHPLPDEATWRSAVSALWREARFREERYGAIALSGDRRYGSYQTLDTIPMYEELIVSGAWWDYVDQIASNRIGPLLAAYPRPMKPLLRRWSRDRDLWKRRTAILAQLTFKDRTDLALLFDCIQPNLADREFFIRKAIGWALRQYAWTDPHEIRRYVADHEDELSGLSRREALKNIGSRDERVG